LQFPDCRQSGTWWRLARETRPDLILLDVTVPKLAGPEVLRALKNDPRTKAIPVIVLTAPSEKQGHRLFHEGATAYLEKSDQLFQNDSATLIETVVQALGETAVSKN
jgi:CheY-like chemotaxis protein